MDVISKGWLAAFSRDDLRAKIARAPYDGLWARLKRRTAETIGEGRASGFTKGWAALAWHSHTPMAMEAGLIHALEGDPAMLAWVEDGLAAVAAQEEGLLRNAPAGKPPRLLVLSHGELALAADLCRATLSPVARDTLLRLARDRWIDDHPGAAAYTGHSGGSNIPLCQTINAAFVALTWGAESGHPRWEETLDHAVRHARCYLRYGCDAAGFGYEGTGYSHTVFHFIYTLAQLLAQSGRVNLFDTEPVLRRAVDASLQLLFPDASSLVNINDLGLLHPVGMPWLLHTARHYKDPLHLGFWHAFNGPDSPDRPYGDAMDKHLRTFYPGTPPVDQTAGMLQAVLYWDAAAPVTPVERADRPTAVYSPGTETVCFRTSWEKDAVFVNFLGAGRSHASLTHGHADAGHFSVFAHGEYLAIDTGRYNVNEDQHNTMLVDGRCFLPVEGWGLNTRSGRIRAFQRHALLDYACADTAGMKNCVWADRHLLVVPLGGDAAYLVVIDNVNRDHQPHAFWWQLHAHPDSRMEVRGPAEASVIGAKARLDLTFAIPGPADYPESPHSLRLRTDLAWWAWPYGNNPATRAEASRLLATGLATSSVQRPRLTAVVSGLNGQVLTVISPRRAGEPPLTVRRVAERRVLRVEVEAPGWTDTILAALDHGCLALEDARGFTELALIRRYREAGQPAAVWTSSGETLEMGLAFGH